MTAQNMMSFDDGIDYVGTLGDRGRLGAYSNSNPSE